MPEQDADNLISAMARPDFYPDRPDAVELRQTHISQVFLAGQFVYKLKKPVRLAFVDYSTLELRYHYCQEEVRLNRRLTPRVYLGVLPIIRQQSAFALGERAAQSFDPAAVEYAVKMRRLPEERMLENLLRAGQAGGEDLRRIAELLAAFHKSAPRDRSMVYGCAQAIAESIDRNLEECRPFAGETLTASEFATIERFNRHFVSTHRELLERRAREGMVREGHGDLRSEHICVTEHIDVVDCVEFSERLRYADVASDFAFLLMDLDRLGAPVPGHQLLSAYIRASGDPELCTLLNFYKCYRAVVRGKVATLKSRERENSGAQRHAAQHKARGYFALASRYARAGSPALIVVCGLSASGKSTIAQALSERIGFEVFNSDVLRKRLAGLAPASGAGAPYGEGIYGEELTAKTYDALYDDALKTLHSGRGVIIDATFKDAGQRGRFQDLAQRMGVPIVFVQCVATPAEVKRRLDARQSSAGAVSDATWEIYLRQKEDFAPFGPETADYHLTVDSAQQPPAAIADQIERFLADHAQAARG